MTDTGKINVRAILLAPLAAFAASLALAFCAGLFLFAVALAFDGGPDPDSIAFTFVFLALFVLPTYVLCGYIASRMAETNWLTHAGIASVIFLIANVLMAFPFDPDEPISASDVLCYASIVPLGLFGGFIATKHGG